MDVYDFKKSEEEIINFWDKEKIFKFDVRKKGKIYSIDTPPPTVSGKMHIGHAFSYSQQDFIARYRRMKENVFYPFGTDDNGLPTERLVEKLRNVKSRDVGREEFIKLCIETLKKIIPDFVKDWKRLGVSCDYDISYSTIDDNSRKISQKSFIELFRKNRIYRKEFPTIWCPECQTSIAQAELEDKEKTSFFNTIKFFCGEKEIQISTTRPELLGACVAIFVNPRDKRYKSLVGKKARVPLFNFEVPILEDESAEMDKGTGVLMVCSYGDKYDVDAINRHKLEPKIIINKDGSLNFGSYKGMNVKDARKKIIEDLKKENLLVEQKEIKHVVNVHDKCGTEIEFLPTEQWFIRVLDIKKELIEQGKKIKWHPEFMFRRYENWIEGLEWDWNISRERYFGVPIPVWECEECKKIIIADEEELPVDPLKTNKKCPVCKKDAKGEEKVLDTWATSSLTPEIASFLVKGKIGVPFSLRPQAHDIIRTWLFYTIVKSYLHKNEIPWENVMISGFVTLEGKKMSKSKGNVIQPQEVFDKYGADAIRFWAAGSKLGEDLNYQEKDLISGKKFVNKLWNASKFVFMNFKERDGKVNLKKNINLSLIDEWFLEKLDLLVDNCTNFFEDYEYSKVKLEVEKFFWNVFCDNYLEIVKKRIYENKDFKDSALFSLYNGLLIILKLISPITPFVTEKIYQEYFRRFEKEKSIHLSSWPESKRKISNDNFFDLFIEVLGKIRQEKTFAKKPMNSKIILVIDEKNYKILENVLEDLKDVSNSTEIKKGKKFEVKFVD